MGLNFTSSDLFVYVHIPFCVKRCFYCDFVSSTDSSLIDDYFNALIVDIRSLDRFLRERSIRTVYFGGGTPSFVDPVYLYRVLREFERFDFDPVEITVELNPESTTKGKLVSYRDMGVNRISLGVQAFDEDVLKLSGRPHGTWEILKALEKITNLFENFNLDFIVGLPGYDEGVVAENLKLVDEFNPAHVSVYTLELHEDTPIYRMYVSGKLNLPEDTMDLFFKMLEGLKEMGYERYEISNFARENMYSVHNLSYWYSMNYLGFGVSAGGYLSGWRYVKTPNVREYIKNPEELSYDKKNNPCEDSKEILFMGLRLVEGVQKIRAPYADSILEEISEYVSVRNGYVLLNDIDNSEAFEIIANFDCSDS